MNELSAQFHGQPALRGRDGVDPSSYAVSRFDEGHPPSGFRQDSGGRKSGDACADDDHVLHCTSQVSVSARGPCVGTGCLSASIDKVLPGRTISGVKPKSLPTTCMLTRGAFFAWGEDVSASGNSAGPFSPHK